jgi:2-C-methyl-D-erythritol 4-phosphate cytidylyltransferase/2-C-methyl-D-erythritol 2,4-cyclodiphosphate synthase
VILVLAAHNIEAGEAMVVRRGLTSVISVVQGGSRRQDSVRIGLEALTESDRSPDYVAIHDGPRPFIDEPMLARGLNAAIKGGAAIPAVAVTDTIKKVNEDGIITSTPDRSTLRAVQTPQIFELSMALEAHRRVPDDVTDDAMMVERIGRSVTVFEGSPDNIKITNPGDLEIAERIFAVRQRKSAGEMPTAGQFRWGTGFDGHALKPGPSLRLGGTDIPFEMHLEGHSDGDVLLHAIASAILGGAGLGDLGAHFPPGAPELAGIDSAEIVRQSRSKAEDAGWLAAYLDATIVAQRPRLSAYLARIEQNVSSVLGLAQDLVNVKVTSTDHVGAIGDGEGIAAQAVVTLRAR